MISLLTFVLVVLLNVRVCTAIQCYSCSSRQLPTVCGSEFQLTDQNASYILNNCDTCHKFLNKTSKEITRNCTLTGSTSFQMSFGCKTETIHGHVTERCSCNKELCNGARTFAYQEYTYLLMLNVLLWFVVGCKLK